MTSDAELLAQIEAAKPEPPPVRTLGEYLEAELAAPPQLVSPSMVVRGGLSAIVAAGGVGKTSVSLGRLLRWAGGLPWLPDVPEAFCPTKPLKTLIIENEGAGGLFQKKVQTMIDNAPADLRAKMDLVKDNVLVWGEGGYSGIRMDDPPAVAQVKAALNEWDPDILFLEPFARLWSGNENDNSEMNRILSALEDLASKHDCAIMLAHHRRKGKVEAGQSQQDFARGASALEGAVTYMEFLSRSKNGWAEIDCTKNRYDDAPGPYYLDWQGNGMGWYEHVDAVGKIVELLTERQEALTAKQIGRADTGIGEDEHRVEAMLELGMRQKRVRYEDSLKGYIPWGGDLREANNNGAAGAGF